MSINLTYSAVRNPKWGDQANTIIVCEVNFDHEPDEWVEFAAVASGDLPHAHDIFAECVAGDYGSIADFEPVEDITGDDAMSYLRKERDRRLAETDWWANSDRTMTSEQTAYRQALRDLPSNSANVSISFDYSKDVYDVRPVGERPTGYDIWTNVTWPTKPS